MVGLNWVVRDCLKALFAKDNGIESLDDGVVDALEGEYYAGRANYRGWPVNIV